MELIFGIKSNVFKYRTKNTDTLFQDWPKMDLGICNIFKIKVLSPVYEE